MRFNSVEDVTAYIKQHKPPFGTKWVYSALHDNGDDLVLLEAEEKWLIDPENVAKAEPATDLSKKPESHVSTAWATFDEAAAYAKRIAREWGLTVQVIPVEGGWDTSVDDPLDELTVDSAKAKHEYTPERRHPTPRVAHCFACHATLSSTANRKCGDCGWLVCTCGACDCDR